MRVVNLIMNVLFSSNGTTGGLQVLRVIYIQISIYPILCLRLASRDLANSRISTPTRSPCFTLGTSWLTILSPTPPEANPEPG